MKKALNLIFWGYILTIARIDIGVDILLDPVGYGLIALGLDKLSQTFKVGIKARTVALGLMIFSFPTIMIDVNKVTTIGWVSYKMALALVNLILVYYIFILFKHMLENNPLLLRRTENIFIVYLIINFIVLLQLAFSVNLPPDFNNTLALLFIISALIMEIVFLLLIRSIRRDAPNEVY